MPLVTAHDGLLSWPGPSPTALADWRAELFLSDGDFVVERSGWYFITAAAGGGGGRDNTFNGPAGAGACIQRLPVYMFEGMVLAIKIGKGGVNGAPGSDGTETRIGDWVVLGGGESGGNGAPGNAGTLSGEYFNQFDVSPTNMGEDGGIDGIGIGGHGIDSYTTISAASDALAVFQYMPFVAGIGVVSTADGQTAAGYGTGGGSSVGYQGQDGADGMVLIGWIGT